jgi:hypothetical protein
MVQRPLYMQRLHEILMAAFVTQEWIYLGKLFSEIEPLMRPEDVYRRYRKRNGMERDQTLAKWHKFACQLGQYNLETDIIPEKGRFYPNVSIRVVSPAKRYHKSRLKLAA